MSENGTPDGPKGPSEQAQDVLDDRELNPIPGNDSIESAQSPRLYDMGKGRQGG